MHRRFVAVLAISQRPRRRGLCWRLCYPQFVWKKPWTSCARLAQLLDAIDVRRARRKPCKL